MGGSWCRDLGLWSGGMRDGFAIAGRNQRHGNSDGLSRWGNLRDFQGQSKTPAGCLRYAEIRNQWNAE